MVVKKEGLGRAWMEGGAYLIFWGSRRKSRTSGGDGGESSPNSDNNQTFSFLEKKIEYAEEKTTK